MPDIRYVCLSDLHFGAENSILSCLQPGTVLVNPTQASTVLDALAAALNALVAANGPSAPKPTLILNGDVLELALTTDNVALMVFELFLDRIFPPEGGLFDSTVLYLPGNHDHHLWETARERQYANLMDTLPAGEELPIPWHATSLYYLEDPRPVQSDLLDLLARHRPRQPGLNFRVSYPNLGVRSDDNKTSIVFHHGHFVESIYELMTELKSLIFPGRVQPIQVWDVEAENFAWIDFFWSTLGRSGDVGEDVGLVYDMLQSTGDIELLAGNLGNGLTKKIAAKGVARWFRWLIRPILDKSLKFVAGKVAAAERRTPTKPLSDKANVGLMAYLGGPLLRQLASETANDDGQLPEQVKFIFGHTHKPFVSSRVVPGLKNPVRIFNSGGWVVDTPKFEPLHGANLVLIDETMEVACVRLYNQAVSPAAYRVRLDDGLPAEQGPFYQRLSGLINAGEQPWAGFSAAAAGLVTEREAALKTIIDNAGTPRKAMPGPTSPTSPPGG
jgi:metallophosphoesterase superfamily enzyme